MRNKGRKEEVRKEDIGLNGVNDKQKEKERLYKVLGDTSVFDEEYDKILQRLGKLDSLNDDEKVKEKCGKLKDFIKRIDPNTVILVAGSSLYVIVYAVASKENVIPKMLGVLPKR